MTKPDDIPQDVWDATMALMDRHLYGKMSAQEAIARAIMAEREACAQVAEKLLVFADTTSESDKVIAAAIRTGGEQ